MKKRSNFGLNVYFPLLLILFFLSCNMNTESKENQLLSQEELSKKKIYTNLDSLPSDLSEIYRLDLSGQQLRNLPKIITQLTSLQELNLSNNELNNLKGIESLSNLQRLNVGANKIKIFPIQILSLSHLKSLSLFWNPISDFPDEFFNNCSELEELDITSLFSCDFEKIFPKIHELKALKKILIGNNEISRITIRFESLNCLREFSLIGQKGVDLKKLCTDLSKCKNLEILHLSRNRISSIPDEIKLLKNLKQLNLFDNNIQILPESLLEMTQLKEVILLNNPIEIDKIHPFEKRMKQTIFSY